MATPARTVEIAFTGSTAELEAALKRAGLVAKESGGVIGNAFTEGTSKAGAGLSKLSNLGASFGLPFTGALDKIAQKLDAATTKTSKLGTVMGELGKVTVMGGAVGLAAVGVEAVKLADSYEKAHASLTAAVSASGQSFSSWQGQIGATEKKMEALGFTNAQVESALAASVVSTQNVGKSLSTMGLAADLARMKGIDLTSATELLDKALTGNLRPLKQLGIDLPVASSSAEKLQQAQLRVADAQAKVTALQNAGAESAAAGSAENNKYLNAQLQLTTAQYNLGQQSNATKVILDALNQRLGGQATAYTKTLSGETQVLKTEFEDTGKNLGMWLIPKLTDLGRFLVQNKVVVEGLAAAIAGVLGMAVTVFAVQTVQKFISGVGSMISSILEVIGKSIAMGTTVEAEDAGMVVANGLASASFIALGASIDIAFAALGILLAGFLAFEASTKVFHWLFPSHKSTSTSAQLGPASIKYEEQQAAKQQAAQIAKEMGAGTGKSSATTAAAVTAAAAAAAAGSATSGTGVSKIAAENTRLSNKGNTDLTQLSNVLITASMVRLKEDLTTAHKQALAALVARLDATHLSALKKLGANLLTVEKQAQDVLNAKLLVAHETALANQTQLMATQLAGMTTLETDTATQQIQAITDMANVVSASFSSAATAIQDATQAMTDAATGQVSAISDAAQTQADVLGERGLYGLQLQAQQQTVVLDQMKQSYDAQIAQATQAVDSAKSATDNQLATAQAAIAQAAQAQNAIVSSAQNNLDTITAQANNMVQQAQNQVDQASTGSTLQQNQAAAALKSAQAQAAQTEAQANAQLSNAQNQANMVNAQLNAVLSGAQGNAAVITAQAQQAVAVMQNQANVAEANQQSIIKILQAEASTQFAGSGLNVNIVGLPMNDAAAIGSEVSWVARNQLGV